jgi:2-polyprenyl-3-methyl-5-hydroxy-6-metoxy-1,4-benzoquinol methylase
MNPNLTKLPSTDPALILQYRDRQYGAELLTVAILHLDLFSWLDEHPASHTRELCEEFEIKDRPADVLLTLCRASGFISTDEEDRHSNTKLATEHLVKGSPWYLGPYYAPIKHSPIVESFLQLLRTGKPGNWQAKDDGDDWHKSMMSEDFARSFTDLMNCRGLAFGQKLSEALTSYLGERKHVLDVGGGSGIFSCSLVAAHEQLSATVLEQMPVDAIVRKEVDKHALADRVYVYAADMFEDAWPEGADIVLLSNVLHDWDLPEVEVLLNKTSDYLEPGGLLVIHEAFINDTKDGPLAIAEYSALLMNITQGKCYSHAEYASVLRELDFEVGDFEETIANRGFMTAIKK